MFSREMQIFVDYFLLPVGELGLKKKSNLVVFNQFYWDDWFIVIIIHNNKYVELFQDLLKPKYFLIEYYNILKNTAS